MKELQTVTSRYQAIDGTEFAQKNDCEAYESSLPPHLFWCLKKRYTQDQLMHMAVWRIGKTYSTSYEVYEAPAFLREGGCSTVTDSHESTLGYARGALTDVVQWAIDKHHINRCYNAFIEEISLTDLTEEPKP